MADLIFHIGLPRTGSTLLQRSLWRSLSGLGRNSATAVASGLRRAVNFAPPGIWRTPPGRRTADEVARSGLTDPILYSDEDVYAPLMSVPAWPFVSAGRAPWLAAHLGALDRHAWPHGQVKALVFVRRQWTWLASIYAHEARRIRGAGQADFDARLERFFGTGWGNGERSLDYHRLLDELATALGPANVHLELYEGLNEAGTWQRIADFTGLPRLAGAAQELGVVKNAQSRTDTGGWEPAGWRLGKTGRRLGRRLARTGRPVRPVGDALAGFAERLDAGRGSIAVSPPWVERIAGIYALSNARLAARTGLDLVGHGYSEAPHQESWS